MLPPGGNVHRDVQRFASIINDINLLVSDNNDAMETMSHRQGRMNEILVEVLNQMVGDDVGKKITPPIPHKRRQPSEKDLRRLVHTGGEGVIKRRNSKQRFQSPSSAARHHSSLIAADHFMNSITGICEEVDQSFDCITSIQRTQNVISNKLHVLNRSSVVLNKLTEQIP